MLSEISPTEALGFWRLAARALCVNHLPRQQGQGGTIRLREKEILQTIFDHIPVMITFIGADGRVKLVNREWVRTFGWSPQQIQNQKLDILAEFYPDPAEQKRLFDFIANSQGQSTEFRPRLRDGRIIDTTWAMVRLSDGTAIAIGRDISDQKLAQEGLRISREQLRALSARLESLREEERIRMSREIHDELGQRMTALKMDLQWLERRIGELEGVPGVNQLLDRSVGATELIDELLRSIQEIVADIRPCVLDQLGLGPALQFEARRFEQRYGTRCDVHLPEPEPLGSKEVSTALFRIFKECLTNIARHGGATHVAVKLSGVRDELILIVRDNGHGITDAEVNSPASLGILGMRERAALLGGRLEIQGGSFGTIVTVRVPAG